mmetsp:Transcript_12099/g.41115  ORF Transcript_12099/g.41115 Transcript_12099/m.41115 type:complete len:297 (-) Transcript_12099:216-1106(-)
MVARVEEQLGATGAHEGPQGRDEVHDEAPLGAGAAHGHEEAQRAPRARPRGACGRVHSRVLHELPWDPVTSKAHLGGRDAHAQEGVQVGRALDEVERAGDDDEPLGVVVDDEVDHTRKARGDRCHAHQAVRRDDRRPLVQAREQRLEVLSHLPGGPQRVLVPVAGERAPEALHGAAELRGEARAPRVGPVRRLDELRLGRIDREEVVEVGSTRAALHPRGSRVSDTEMAEAHADGAQHHGGGGRGRARRAALRGERAGHLKARHVRRGPLAEGHGLCGRAVSSDVHAVQKGHLGAG